LLQGFFNHIPFDKQPLFRLSRLEESGGPGDGQQNLRRYPDRQLFLLQQKKSNLVTAGFVPAQQVRSGSNCHASLPFDLHIMGFFISFNDNRDAEENEVLFSASTEQLIPGTRKTAAYRLHAAKTAARITVSSNANSHVFGFFRNV
jgi:hypothetical protein